MTAWRGFQLGVSLAGFAAVMFPAVAAEASPLACFLWLVVQVSVAASEAVGWVRT